MILTNPVVVSVIVLTVLCLLKFNILLALIVSAIVGGVLGGMPIFAEDVDSVIGVLIDGMGGNSGTALSYILLGAFAVGLAQTGLGTLVSKKLSKSLSGKRLFMCFALAFIACFSQNLVPIHIAFVPILIPPLLSLFNEQKLDRRAVAVALTFGLKAPYITIPLGFGDIFHGVVADNISNNGLAVTKADTARVLWIGGLSMLIGLIIMVLFFTRKDRIYEDRPVPGANENENDEVKMTRQAWGALIACIAVAFTSIKTQSLPLSAMVGLGVMVITGAIKYKDVDEIMNGGINMMGFIAFVMLVAAGYGEVLKATGAVDSLVNQAAIYMQGSKGMAAFIMLLIGLVITMGIGSSFSTVPIICAIYVPLCIKLGFSMESTILLVGLAGALGDAGSPASDSTLGPTSGLNADGQHDHIWDTCVPTFIAFNIPLIIGGVIGTMILG